MATIEKRVSKKGEVSYRVKIRMLGHEHVTETFTRLTDAKRWAQDTESAIRDGRHFRTAEAKKHTMGEAIDRYIKDILPQKPKNEKAVRAQLVWWKNQIGAKLLADVTPALIGEKRDKLLNEPITSTRREKKKGIIVNEITTTKRRSPATVVRYMAAISVVFTEAFKEWGWLETSPMAKVKKPKEAKGRVRFLDDNERVALLEACKGSVNTYLFPIVVLALSTGMRAGEIMNLTWDDVDLHRQRIILQETKNGERRAAPLAGLALEEMKRLSKCRRLGIRLIFGSKTARGEHPINIRSAWETAVKKAELEDFRFHDLRHSCASYLAMNGASLAEIAEVLGHKTLQMVKRYAHLSESHTLGVVERMNQKIFG